VPDIDVCETLRPSSCIMQTALALPLPPGNSLLPTQHAQSSMTVLKYSLNL
jgi:hypothetical protein